MSESDSAGQGGMGSRRRLRRYLLLAASLACAGYAAWLGGLYYFQDWLIYHPELATRQTSPPAAAVVSRLDTAAGAVEAWFLPAPAASAAAPAPLVVFCHGNAELIDNQQATAERYLALGCSVLLPEYRGYGRSAGKPSQDAIVADAVRFTDEALARPDVDRTRLLIHGRSLGGGVAAQIALQRPPLALILESTFTSIAGMAHAYLAPEWLVRHPFRTDSVISDLRCPLLIFHGTQDTLIPVAQARKLKSLSQSARLIEYPADHNSFPGEHWEAYWREIEQFLKQHDIIR